MSDPIPIPRRPAEGADRLESWKEIAAYLRREVRTVQGWEKNEGLPVHRHQHGKQGSVYAFRTELDTWREARKGVPDAAPVAEEPAPVGEPEPPAWKRRSTLLVIACLAIVIIASVFVWRNRTASSSGRELSSVVVLPFLDMSPQKDQEYFSDGLTEEIIDALSRVPNLHVVARTSAFAFKGKANDVRQIGRQLNVEAVLEGSVRKAGDDLRITAQLNRVSDGTHLWSRTYDRKLRDVFAVQQQISQSIANQLRAGDVPQALPARNLEAYARYQEGLYFFNQHQIPDSYWKALESYQQAIRLDPQFARAYAAMAEAYAYLAENFAVWPKEVFPKAKEAADKAVALDDNLAEAHTSRGIVKLDYEWDREGAWREFQRALELDPGSGWVHHWVAHTLETQGKLDEAMKEMRAALALDPLSIPIHWDIANELLSAGRFDEAVKFLDHAEELFPGYPIIEWQRADAAYRKGDRQAAMRIAETLLTQNPELTQVPAMLSLKGVVAGWAGRRTEAQQILGQIEQIRQKQYVDAFTILELCSALGDHEKLMLWARRAYEDRSTTFLYLPMASYLYEHDAGVTAFLARTSPKPGS
jgi:TolB-like protein